MSNAFNNFLSSVGEGLAGEGSPNMKNYTHATKLYVEGSYARAPKVNHLYFVAFNINDGVIRDPSWRESGVREVGLLVKSATLPRFKIKTEEMNQYNRKTQIQTKLTYEPVTMEFHDDNSEITNGLWKNYYKYYYTDSIYGGKDDTVSPSPSKVSLGEKLFGGLRRPGSKIIKQRETSIVPDAFSNNKYGSTTYPYGLDNLQTVSFFKSIDIFVLHQQKFTQMTLVNPKITSWDHDEVGQSDNTKFMRNKMSVVFESVLYNDGKIGKGSNSGVFAEAFYDTEQSPLSISGKGAKSLFGVGGTLAGVEEIFGAGGSIDQGNYWQAILQAATLSKNYDKISTEQAESEGYSMLSTSLGIAVASKQGEVQKNLSSYYANGGFGIYTNQYSKNNLEEIPAVPVVLFEPPQVVAADEVPAVATEPPAVPAVETATPASPLSLPEAQAKQINEASEEITTEKNDAEAAKNLIDNQKAYASAMYTMIDLITPTASNVTDPAYIQNSNYYTYKKETGSTDEEAYKYAEDKVNQLRNNGVSSLSNLQQVINNSIDSSNKLKNISENLSILQYSVVSADSQLTAESIKNSKDFGLAIKEIQSKNITNNAVDLVIEQSRGLSKLIDESDSIKNNMMVNREQQSIFKSDLIEAQFNYKVIDSYTSDIWIKYWPDYYQDRDGNAASLSNELDEVYFTYSNADMEVRVAEDEASRTAELQKIYNLSKEDATKKYNDLIDRGRANYYAELGKASDKVSELESKIIPLKGSNIDNLKAYAVIGNNIDTNTIITTNGPAKAALLAETVTVPPPPQLVADSTVPGGLRVEDVGPSNIAPPVIITQDPTVTIQSETVTTVKIKYETNKIDWKSPLVRSSPPIVIPESRGIQLTHYLTVPVYKDYNSWPQSVKDNLNDWQFSDQETVKDYREKGIMIKYDPKSKDTGFLVSAWIPNKQETFTGTYNNTTPAKALSEALKKIPSKDITILTKLVDTKPK